MAGFDRIYDAKPVISGAASPDIEFLTKLISAWIINFSSIGR